LPDEADEPTYEKLDFNDTPVLYLAVTSQDGADETRLYRVADEIVRPRLEAADGVARAVVVGGQEPEVQVDILPDKLRAHGLTINDVTAAVHTQFVSTAGGEVKDGSGSNARRSSIRIDARGSDPSASSGQRLDRLGALPVKAQDGFQTELRNVANVHMS